MKTIGRNQAKRISAIFAAARYCRQYSREDHYQAVPVRKEAIYDEWQRWAHAKLLDKGEGHYTVRVDGGLYYDFDA